MKEESYFEVLSRNLTEKADESHKKITLCEKLKVKG
jgi:hypothetical protein